MKKSIIIIAVLVGFCVSIVVGVLLIFPKTFKSEIVEISSKYDLSSSMVASIINIESGYDEHAISKSGAVGLMQLLPTTAMECAERLNISISSDDLFDKNINIELGCFYLKYLLDMFGGNKTNALVAYNWGPQNVKDWIQNGNVDSGGTITNIPVKESRQYIKKFKVNEYLYRNIFGYK